MTLTAIFENHKRIIFALKIFLLVISGIAVAYSLRVIIGGTFTNYFQIQYVAFFIIWAIEFFLLLKFPKAGIFAFPGASILFYLFVTNRMLRDAIGVINPYAD